MQTRHPALAIGVTLTFFAAALAGCTSPTGGPGGDELRVGTIFPMTGSLDRFGPIMRAAAEKAAEQVAAGGGMRVRLIHEDSGTNPGAGATAAQKLKGDGVSVVVGAAASGVSKAVLEVTGPSGIVQISPASTSPEFTSLMEGRGAGERFFFRTSPSDALQGKVAGAYAQARNWSCVVVLYDNNPYGNGLRSTFTGSFGQAGNACVPGQRVVKAFGFEEKQSSYDSVLQQALAGCTASAPLACPSGIFFAGYPTEALQMVKDWWARTEWRDIPWLFSEGVQEQGFFDDIRAAGITAVTGFEGTAPVGVGPGHQAYRDMLGQDPPLFSAHTFDAVMLAALAAEKAGSRDAAAIRDNLRAVATPPGERIGPADFARAREVLQGGGDVDYEGAAGSQNFDALGDVTSAYEIYEIGSDGKLGRKCLIEEEAVVQTTVELPAACTGGTMDREEPPATGGNRTGNNTNGTGTGPLAVVLKETNPDPTSGKLWSVEPMNATRPAGQAFNITVRSEEGNAAPHNLTLIRGTNGSKVASHDPHLAGGDSATFDVPALEAGRYTYYCAVPGHRELGMEGALMVVAAA